MTYSQIAHLVASAGGSILFGGVSIVSAKTGWDQKALADKIEAEGLSSIEEDENAFGNHLPEKAVKNGLRTQSQINMGLAFASGVASAALGIDAAGIVMG